MGSLRLIRQRGSAAMWAYMILTLVMFGGIAVVVMLSQFTHRTDTITVQRTERVSEGKSARYLIWTDKGVYEDTDSFLNGKFNSSDLYGQLQAGHTYACNVIGWRIPVLSWYPNLISCNEKKA